MFHPFKMQYCLNFLSRTLRTFGVDRIYFLHYGTQDRIVLCDYKKGAILSIEMQSKPQEGK